MIGDKKANLNTKTPADALTEIETLQSDGSFMEALYDQLHPGHPEAMKRWDRAHDLAYPDPE